MFSDSRAPAPGEQKGFKPHAPHFIPWLRNSLKPQHGGDLGLNGAYKSGSEARNNLTPLERAKGIGFFSIPGKDRAKKGDVRCSNGVARMLPVVLRGHHILQGKQREDSPARWTQSPELDPLPVLKSSAEVAPAPDNHTFVRNHLSPLIDGTSVRKYGPLVRPPPAPEEPNCKDPVVVDMELRRGYATTLRRKRDLHSSSWASPDTQGLIERQQGFTSSFSYIQQQSRNSQSQRDLRHPSEGFNGPLNGVIFSTEVPQSGTTTLRGPRKPRPSVERIAAPGQNQAWAQYKPTHEGGSPKKGPGCNRKVVRNQIKRVVDNLEQVLTALRDVHQEMKEVVQQIDYLTSSIDLNAEGTESSSSSGSVCSEVTAVNTHQRPPDPKDPSCRRDLHNRSKSPPNMLLCPVNSAFSSERSRTLRLTCSLGFSPRQGGPLHNNPPLNLPTHNVTLSPQRSLPVRPPTPGLSPLTVNLHHPSSPGSRPHSPKLSPKPHPPPTLSPSVITEDQVRSHQTPQSDHPSAGVLSKSSSFIRPETDTEKRAPSVGRVQMCSAPAAPVKPPSARGRRGRKPPPYPHHRTSEPTQKVTEPRKAPPYPEKRLSTTV